MREVLFRGKALESHIGDNKHDRRWSKGDWIYGVPSQHDDGAVWMFTTDSYTIAVDPETVGQYTGLDDENGVKIFEGDIDDEGDVVVWGTGKYEIECGFGPIISSVTGWHWKGKANSLLPVEGGEVIIGNIHDAEVKK